MLRPMAYRNEFRPNGIDTYITQVHAYFAKYNYRLYIYIYYIYIYIYMYIRYTDSHQDLFICFNCDECKCAFKAGQLWRETDLGGDGNWLSGGEIKITS